MRDNRTKEIKAILKASFPNHKHTCRLNKFAGGESFDVNTSYLPDRESANFDREIFNIRMKEIKKLLKTYRDDSNGEGCGNTYLYVDSL